MPNEIEQPNPDDVLKAITSFNDPSIITNIFNELGWSYSMEIRETLMMAKQNANLSIKFKAIKHLRELLREAAEAAGYVANVSSTAPNAAGGHTTFSAKRIAGILNPVKKIKSTEIKEPQNEQKETNKSETKHNPIRDNSDRGCDREPSTVEESVDEQHISGTDTRRAFPLGDADIGGTEPPDGGETPRRPKSADSAENKQAPSEGGNPCIKTRPPTCDRDLFPGISTSTEDG